MTLKRVVKVLIVDDSLFFRTALQRALLNDPGITVVGTAGGAAEAAKKIQELSPDVITMDVEMPDMKGTDFIRKMLPKHPIPVLLVSSLDIGIFEALDAGAVDFVRKPNCIGVDCSGFFNELAVKIKIASTAKVKTKTPINLDALATPTLNVSGKGEKIIAIGASTGGTEATLEILKKLPANIPGILVVQHMPAGFTKMYADRLDRLCNFSVTEAKGGERVEPGRAFIAAGDKHMTLAKDSRGYYIKCAAGEKVSGHCPSVDVLFHSVAETAGKDAMGIILTGMGSDGAKGLLEMKKKGSYTIGQDKASCVVYGMPMVAFEMGAVTRQAACSSIASLIIQRLNQAK
ncbi:protein-glutamate methylesterase/protein-glutamine glutaminase [Clostridium minihomine]|uniref:protein-glutamate methylesterase/protein-glutamine glutaminase n=1 Tax=Clostridium minihomine TaxID=2045012 RepID=UPI000C77320B|nr:chemotaxis response regulator protein-glutamate methylesterase [Clostridium minihomine]